jgi:hypothetical protein
VKTTKRPPSASPIPCGRLYRIPGTRKFLHDLGKMGKSIFNVWIGRVNEHHFFGKGCVAVCNLEPCLRLGPSPGHDAIIRHNQAFSRRQARNERTGGRGSRGDRGLQVCRGEESFDRIGDNAHDMIMEARCRLVLDVKRRERAVEKAQRTNV